jgi:hypothetical protein
VSYGLDRFELLKNSSQITLQARYRRDEAVPKQDFPDQFLNRDRLYLGLQYRYGDPQLTFLLQGLFVQSKTEGQTANESFRLSFGAEFKLVDNVWLEMQVGGFLQHSTQENPSFMTFQIKWAP